MTRALRQELKQARAFESPEQAAYLGLVLTASALQARVSRLLKQHGLSEPQYNVLRILRGAGEPLPCLEAASRMITQLPDITRLVDRIEAAGLATRTRSEQDRRVVLVELSAEGRQLLAKLDAPIAALQVELLGHMTRRELGELGALLDKARQAVSRASS